MKKLIPVILLERYINGTCTAEEQQLVKQWYASFDHEPDATVQLSAAEEKELSERIYNNILYSLEEHSATPVKRLPARKWYGWAAAASVITALGVTMLFHKSRVANNQAQVSIVAELKVIKNTSGRILRSSLPDGSVVWLEPSAQISYPKHFAAASRDVSMNGECFFEVTKNPKRPFIISSRHIVTKVWGTSFLVRDNAQQTAADVSVMTGKVSVAVKKDAKLLPVVARGEVMLYPHQKVVYQDKTQSLQAQTATAADQQLHIWERVNLSFANKQMGDIIQVLNSTFHVHIKTNNSKLNHYMLNADMDGFNLPEVLETLKKVLNINYRISANEIELV